MENVSPIITAKNLNLWYGDFKALKDISLDMGEREITALIGPSGCGKSTFLRCLNLLEKPTGGSIIYHGTDLVTAPPKESTKLLLGMGMVFQQFNLFPHKTVLDNIMLAPVKVQGVNKKTAEERAMALLQTVGLADKRDAYPNQLSGGQQQRVSIARALAGRPAVILADEPTGALDSRTGKHVLEILHGLHDDGSTIILITHDNGIAATAERVVRISDGHIIYDGDREGAFL